MLLNYVSTCFPPPYFARMFYLFVLCWGPWLVVYHCYAVISLLIYWCVWVGLPKHAIVTVWKETFIPRSASGQLASTFSPDSDIMAVETLLTLLWIRKIFSYKHTSTKKITPTTPTRPKQIHASFVSRKKARKNIQGHRQSWLLRRELNSTTTW